MPAVDRPECLYSVVVSRAEERPRAGFWPLRLRDRLPTVPIPLREPDGDAEINLQEVLNRVYDAYGYEDFVYAGSPDPSLTPDDAAWAKSWYRSRGETAVSPYRSARWNSELTRTAQSYLGRFGISDHHINIFASDEDGVYIADIPDLTHCSAFGATPEVARAQVLVARAAWLEADEAEGKPVPAPRYRPAIYQVA